MKIRTPQEVGLAIRQRRRELNLTQAELAHRIGVGRQWISAVERGKQGVELGLVLRAVRALDAAISIGANEPPPRSDDFVDLDDVIRSCTRADPPQLP